MIFDELLILNFVRDKILYYTLTYLIYNNYIQNQ